MPISIIEKDYYVTLVLKEIVKRNPDIVFKGGTSISKCYKIIDRFSEDIDLSIIGETRPEESKRKKLNRLQMKLYRYNYKKSHGKISREILN